MTDPDPRYWPTAAAYRLPPRPDPEQHMTVQISTAPPDTDQHDDDGDPDGSARLAVHWIAVDDQSIDAGVQLFGAQASDPELFADALLRAALGVATAIGPDHAWALTAALIAFDGSRR